LKFKIGFEIQILDFKIFKKSFSIFFFFLIFFSPRQNPRGGVRPPYRTSAFVPPRGTKALMAVFRVVAKKKLGKTRAQRGKP
jgi:hypothetical protein